MDKLTFYQDDKEIQDQIDFGLTIPGVTKLITLDIKNTNAVQIYDLKFTVADRNVKILAKPSYINPGDTKQLILEYTPKETAEKGLRTTFEVTGRYVT